MLELLANRRRRHALYTLADAEEGIVSISDLTEEVATLEAALAGGPLTQERYLETARDLVFWHLSVLADAGVVDWDDRSGTVRFEGDPTLEAWTARIRRDELAEPVDAPTP